LVDPDGHGIEIYWDKPNGGWWDDNGRLRMVTEPLDIAALFDTLIHLPWQDWARLPVGTVMGHIHLHVANIAAAEQFYEKVLGFDLMLRYGTSASFLAVGGYHHHIGINTWQGVGAPPPAPHDLGLQWYEICVPEGELPPLMARLNAAQVAISERGSGWHIVDPAQNEIRLRISD
jgi:catechol 2,3-dioxygenase